MSVRKSDEDFIKANWDKLTALGGIAVLVLVAVFKFVLTSETAADGSSSSPVGVEKTGDSLKDEVVSALEAIPAPESIKEISDAKGNFLSPEGRKACISPDGQQLGCGRLISSKLESCPYCKVKQTKDIKVVLDTDGDGLLDEYERTYGLDVANDDASADKDGDGFTNMEEFTAKTNPADALSHPDYIDYVELAGEMQKKVSTLVFVGVMPYQGDYRYQFRLPERRNEIDRGTLWALKGEEIANTQKNTKQNPNAHYRAGFVVVEYKPKTQEIKTPWGTPMKKDVSEVLLKRLSDGKIIPFVKEKKETATDVQATLSCSRAGVREIKVIEGQTFRIKDAEFIVEKIYAKDNGRDRGAVKIKNVKSNKERVIECP